MLLMFAGKISSAQEAAVVLPEDKMTDRKGQVYITWGYNRAYYDKSTVHFKGENYDFTLHDARAEDMPESWDPDVYLNPTQFTVPQFNFRMGYYFNKNTAISGGWDHMKYHLIPYQMVDMSGTISDEHYSIEEYTGTFDHTSILYTPQFMDYHHSDGFNFIRVALERRVPFWEAQNKKMMLTFSGCVSAGVMMPWTDFTFFGVNNPNKPHISGYGFSTSAAIRYEFFRYFFLQVNAQFGWSNLTDILLEDPLDSRAEQKIVFFERSFALGGYIPINVKD
jgi:hypothetical protein